MFKGEGGYIGKSMSVRAARAYESGEKPLSKWTKKEIIQIVQDMEFENFSMDNFKKLHLATLKAFILKISSWHHTGALFSETDFYEIDVDYLGILTDERILELVELQKKPKLTDEEKAERAKQREIKKKEKEEKAKAKEERGKKVRLFKYQSRYKTLNGFLNSNMDLEELEQIRIQKIATRREELRKSWETQLPHTEYQLSKIDDDDFIDSYIY